MSLSPLSYALMRILVEAEQGAEVLMTDLMRRLRSSRTAIRGAFRELLNRGYINYSEEE